MLQYNSLLGCQEAHCCAEGKCGVYNNSLHNDLPVFQKLSETLDI